jgi:TRAP-type C4-dicarboxylate transport system substrate-binding protein
MTTVRRKGKFLKRLIITAAAILLLIGWTLPVNAAPPITPIKLIMTHELSTTHFKHTMMVRYAKSIEKKSGGRIKCEVYPGGQLYTDRDAITSLGTGAVHMTWPISMNLEQVNEAYGLISLPLSLDDNLMLNSDQFRQELNDLLSSLVEGKNIKVMGLMRAANGMIMFGKKRNVTMPEDLKNLKIRVTGGLIALDWLKELGVSAIGMPASEMTTALSQGGIDGIMSSPQGWSEIIGSVSKYGLDIRNFWLPTYSILIDPKFLNGLAPDLRKIIQDEMDLIIKDQWQYSIDEDVQALNKVRRNIKGTVDTLTVKQLEGPWLNKARPTLERFKKKYPDVYGRFIDINAKHGRLYPPPQQ